MHKALQRQLKRTLGIDGPDELEALRDRARKAGEDAGIRTLLDALPAFVERVGATYEQNDRDLALRTRSLELSSAELTAANDHLRADLEARQRTAVSLRATVAALLGADGAAAAARDADTLESLSQLVGEIAIRREDERRLLDNLKSALDEHAIVSITDVDGMITYANDRFCHISGYAREELLGANHRILKSGAHDDSLYAQMWENISHGRVWNGEICNRAKDGGLYWVSATLVPLSGADGLPRQYIAIRTDITAQKNAEAALARARDAAQAASRAKSEFLANMSHEIRTPMNGVIGMTDLLFDTALSGEQREYLDVVRSSARALLTVINDILDFSKIEAGQLAIERIPFDLRAMLDETLKPLALRAREKTLTLETAVGADVPTQVIGDPGRLRQVLVNLVGNAIKFTEAGGVRVEVATQADDRRRVCFCVSDSGIGIAADKLALIFEAFAQADGTTTRRYGGTGLGLTISRQLVTLMGGDIDVSSTPGAGSEFRFSVVLEVAHAAAVPPSEDGGAGASVPVPLEVLLVEDHPVNQRLAARMLDKWGCAHELAQNGVEALAALERRRFDVCLMDVMMPVMGGLECTREIRRREAERGLPRLPIIATTANAMQGDRDACLAAGMDDYLSKPIKLPELQARLEAIAQARARPSVAAVAAAPFADFSAGLAQMDAEIGEIIGPAFLESYEQDLATMLRTAEAADHAAVHRLVHSLKGTLAAFGADALAQRALAIETAAMAGEAVLYRSLASALADDVRALARDIEVWLRQRKEVP